MNNVDGGENVLGDGDNTLDNLDDVTGKLTGRENALYRQLRNEERKLAHRMEKAEQLRQLAELNGDEQLLQAAERLEEMALSHYDKRLAKITQFQEQERFGLSGIGTVVTPAP